MISHSCSFTVNSSQRIEGSDNRFSYKIEIPKDREYDRVCLLNAIIPKSYYLIQDGDNSFILQENDVDINIQIPPGNYNRRSFQIVVQGLLNNKSLNGWTYEISYASSYDEADDGKYNFTVDMKNTQGTAVLIMVNDAIHEQFGFYSNSNNYFIDNKLKSSHVVKFVLEDCLYLHSDICSNLSNDSDASDILQVIFAGSNGNFSNIEYKCSDVQAFSKPLSTSKSNVYKFNISNEDGHPINLNGLNIVFTILVFKNDDSFDIIKKIAQGFARSFVNNNK